MNTHKLLVLSFAIEDVVFVVLVADVVVVTLKV
jgi:hypothetical protein